MLPEKYNASGIENGNNPFQTSQIGVIRSIGRIDRSDSPELFIFLAALADSAGGGLSE